MTTSADLTDASAYETAASADFQTMPSVDSWHAAWSHSPLGDPADVEEPQSVRSGQAPVVAAVAAAVLAFGLLGVVAWDHAGDTRSAVVTVVPAAAHPTAPAAAAAAVPAATSSVLATAQPAAPDVQAVPRPVSPAAVPVRQPIIASSPAHAPSPVPDAPAPPAVDPAPAEPLAHDVPLVIVNVPLPQLPPPTPAPFPKLPPPPSAPPPPPPLPTLTLPTPALPSFCLPPKHLVNGQCT